MDRDEMKGAFGKTFSQLRDAAVTGGSIAAASETSEMIVSMVKKHLGKSYPKFLHKGFGKVIEGVAIPCFVLAVTNVFPEAPHAAKINKAAYLAAIGNFHLNGRRILRTVRPLFEDIAANLPEDLLEAIPDAVQSKKGGKGGK